MMFRVLIVEDDKPISTALSGFLNKEGFDTLCAGSLLQAEAFMDREFDLALVDITLPDASGYEVCKRIKQKGDIPVIFLTARTDELSVVTALDMGGDDYIEKPYRPLELVSRMKSVLRRCGKTGTLITLGNVTVDTEKGIVKKNGSDVYLSALEYRIFLVFLNHPGQILSRNKLLSDIWDMGGEFVDDNTLTVYIKRLRKKIEDDPSNPTLIETVRGLGYRISKK